MRGTVASAGRKLVDRLTDKHLERWLWPYLAQRAAATVERRPRGTQHLLLAVCDHYEPLWGGVSEQTARRRVDRWLRDYPALAAGYVDADGYPPRHTFFFPGEQIRGRLLASLGELVARRLGEVELHLHHDGATAEGLRRDIARHLSRLGEHGHLSHPAGRPRYGFIHGNWALANTRPDGRWCGVDCEIQLLFETGCYADFTFPSVPDPTQPPIVNQIYWPRGDLRRRAAHERGRRARVGELHEDRLLMIQGPLCVCRRARQLRLRLEYGALTAHDPATAERVRAWVAQHVHVVGRPEWTFVKIYTHGAGESQAAAYLGHGGRQLHDALRDHFNDGMAWKLHYVTAREMFNIAIAAMSGEGGDPSHYRDYRLPPPPAANSPGARVATGSANSRVSA